MNIKEYLQTQKQFVDDYLHTCLPLDTEKPSTLHEAMRYSVLSKGKRIRPILLLETCAALNGNPEHAIPAAAAIECVHSFSLIHDDLPIIDNDDYRRGILTCHKKFGDAIALLAGDALLAQAFCILSKQSKHLTTDQSLNLVKELSVATSASGIIGGQVVDILAEKKQIEHNNSNLEFIHRNKTGALIVAAVRMGAIIANATDTEMKKLTDAASFLGLAFQIKDDLLDIIGDEQVLGKQIGRDQELGKLTYPAIHGLDKAINTCKQLKEEAIEMISFLDSKGTMLAKLFNFIVEREY